MYFDSKVLKSLIPYSSAIIIICAFINKHIYYSAFGITITDFLNFFEFLTLFMPDILSYVVTVMFSMVVVFFMKTPSFSKSLETQRLSASGHESFWKRFWGYCKMFWPVTMLFIISIVAAIVWIFWIKSSFYHLLSFVFVGTLFIFFVLMEEYDRMYFIKYNKVLSTTVRNLLMTTFILLYFSISRGYGEVYKLKEMNLFGYSAFQYNGVSYPSTKEAYILGMTENYLFYYVVKTDNTSVYKRTDIEIVSGKN